ncbi:MAG TPA: hypothetical protein VGE55_10840 [Limnobacter sp.]|uniref:tetratricopeptide repeat protein n=1 Tax=Limnobacter sp. TaxID=2003368 RepID=UPI002ED893D8
MTPNHFRFTPSELLSVAAQIGRAQQMQFEHSSTGSTSQAGGILQTSQHLAAQLPSQAVPTLNPVPLDSLPSLQIDFKTMMRRVVQQSDPEALSVLVLGHRAGEVEATENLAMVMLQGKHRADGQRDVNTGANLLSHAALQGSVNANYFLGLLLEKGLISISGPEHDLALANRFYVKAAQLGHRESIERLQLAELVSKGEVPSAAQVAEAKAAAGRAILKLNPVG